MKPRGKKNQSKRKSLNLKHKIVRRAADSKRKLRKEALGAAKAGAVIKRKKAKIEIPNDYPFKQEELLMQKARQEQRDADRVKQRELIVKNSQMEMKKKKREAQKAPTRPVESFMPAVESADLLVHVIDARQPLATRCLGLENMDKKNNLIVLTKGDLVPKENLTAWVEYLKAKTGFPVISVLKRANPDQKKKFAGVQAPRERFVKPLGFKQLCVMMQAFSFCKNISVVGYPGVGKHTVAAYLKTPQLNLSRKAKVKVASIIETVDAEANMDLLMGMKPQTAKQPLIMLKRLLERCPAKRELQLALALPEFETVQALLSHIEKERSVVGPIDAARYLLKQWNTLRFFTSPDASLEKEKECAFTALVADDLKAVYAANVAEIQAEQHWGNSTVTAGILPPKDLTSGDAASAKAVGMEVDAANTVTDVTYFEMRSPMGQDIKTVVIGGPEPFGLGGNDDVAMEESGDEEEAPMEE